MNVTVFGAGMVGSVMATDLAQRFAVTAIDLNETHLNLLPDDIHTLKSDFFTAIESDAVQNADILVGAVPGFMGYEMLQRVIPLGKPYIDISFFPEDPYPLHAQAVKTGSIVVMDCGVAPGMSNAILGYEASQAPIDRFTCYVGGLPIRRLQPHEYKAPFSPIDVIEEYTRPARYREYGQLVRKPAMSDIERIDFDDVGSLDAFLTDGLRTLLTNFPNIPHMVEKTLRYPGHIQQMIRLRDAGFFNEDEITVRGQTLRPIDVTSAILMDHWKLEIDEPEFTRFQVKIERGDKVICYDMYDEFDPISGNSSMSRTTGFTCTAMVNAVADGLLKKNGVYAPEQVCSDENVFRSVLNYLADRDISYVKTEMS